MTYELKFNSYSKLTKKKDGKVKNDFVLFEEYQYQLCKRIGKYTNFYDFLEWDREVSYFYVFSHSYVK